METQRIDFDIVIPELGFKQDPRDNLRWKFNDGTWEYVLYFEGYAYVVYKQINLYIRPTKWLAYIYNKFKKEY